MLLSYLNERMQNTVRNNSSAYNLDIARKMEVARFQLIDGLAQNPITVPWLLNKYESNATEVEQETSPTTKLNDALKNLKKLILIDQSKLGENDSQFAEDNQETPHADVLRTFPFSFEDLIELTDLVIYGFQLKELNLSQLGLEKPACWQIRRLRNLTRLNLSALPDRLKTANISDDLLHQLPDETFIQCVIICINAEHLWLKLRQQLVANNVKLVTFIANQYKSEFLDFDDLVQEGQTGLLMAADRFDHRYGCQFSTYAAYWIKQRISRALAQNERVVRVPYEQLNNISKLFRAKEELLTKTAKEPTISDLASYLGITDDEINAMLFIAQTALPLESFANEHEEETFAPIDMIEQEVFPQPFKQMAQAELETWLELAIKALSSRESKIVREHFGMDVNEEMTLQEIGTRLNISRERVRQIQAMAFNKMKLNYGEQLMSFL